MDWEQVGIGVAALAGVTAAGAGLGAAVNRSCTPQDSMAQSITCGPRTGALMYGAGSFMLGGIGGLLLAALNQKYKTMGLSAAAVTGTVLAVGYITGPKLWQS
jgi:hypothetical protein